MAEDGLQALIEGLTARGFDVELKDAGRLAGERYLCLLIRGNLSKGFSGATEEEALRNGSEAVGNGRLER